MCRDGGGWKVVLKVCSCNFIYIKRKESYVTVRRYERLPCLSLFLGLNEVCSDHWRFLKILSCAKVACFIYLFSKERTKQTVFLSLKWANDVLSNISDISNVLGMLGLNLISRVMGKGMLADIQEMESKFFTFRISSWNVSRFSSKHTIQCTCYLRQASIYHPLSEILLARSE